MLYNVSSIVLIVLCIIVVTLFIFSDALKYDIVIFINTSACSVTDALTSHSIEKGNICIQSMGVPMLPPLTPYFVTPAEQYPLLPPFLQTQLHAQGWQNQIVHLILDHSDVGQWLMVITYP